jgi:hypothetical protein
VLGGLSDTEPTRVLVEDGPNRASDLKLPQSYSSASEVRRIMPHHEDLGE